MTPGHDQNDFEMAQRHSLPFLQVFSENGNIDFQICDLKDGDSHCKETLNEKGNIFKVIKIAFNLQQNSRLYLNIQKGELLTRDLQFFKDNFAGSLKI